MPRTYGTDVSYIHDAGFSDYSLNAAPGILKYLRDHGGDRGVVVELGSGSGILARQLGFAGYDVLGVDSSPAMVRLAKKHAPRASFVQTSLVNVRLPQCAAVLAIGEVLSFAYAEHKEHAIDRLFAAVHRALLPGGIFVFDFGRTGRDPGGMPRQGFWTGKDWAILLDAETEDDAGEILTRRFTTFRQVGNNLYRRRNEVHKLRLFRMEDLLHRLQSAGFFTRPLRSIGNLRFRSGHAGVLARKGAEPR